MDEDVTEVAVRATFDERRADEWALVLAAAGIAHRLDPGHDGWRLVVAADDAAAAARALDGYEEENREPPPEAPVVEAGPSSLGALVGLGLAAFFLVTGARDSRVPWFAAGSASAERILGGEPWRVVTALTLHADATHVAGNAIACLIFVGAVARWLGPGVAAWLVLLAGAAGNALTALVHGSHHDSVGASTATFGALGLLAGLRFATRRRAPRTRGRAWLALGAGLALLGMLGMGERSDVFAHLFGLAAGVALALAAARIPRPPGRWAQAGLAATAAAAIAGCWALAL